METITMTSKELTKYDIIMECINQKINGTEASKKLGLSTRQVRRIKAKVKKRGAKGIIHGNRGKTSNRKIDNNTTRNAVRLLKSLYADFGPTFAKEKLEEEHDIVISDETVRQIMIDKEIWRPKPRKQNKQYRKWRPRKEHYGEMQQFDGSYHKWFEERSPECCLLASIDDATGKATKLKFDLNESVKSVFSFWKGYTKEHGKPGAIYIDKYSTYKINHASAVDNSELLTQFQRAMKEFDTRLITAHSPQAKGRIERLFETLQDRLVKELRLRNISDIETANRFLEEEYIHAFNKKFSVKPMKPNDLHRQLNEYEQNNLDAIFSVQSTRQINNDFTIRFKNQWLQLAEIQPTTVLRTDTVLMEERLDETIWIRLKGTYLDYTVLPKRPEKVNQKINLVALTRTKAPWKPPKDHPWRRPFLYGKQVAKVEKQQA